MAYQSMFAAEASVEDRASFILRTYAHLVGAIMAFVALLAGFFVSGVAGQILQALPSGRGGVLLIFGGLMLVSFLATRLAQSDASPGMQYLGLGLYVVAQAVIFVPLLAFATVLGADIIPTAGLITVVLFACLTGVVFITRKDFSFLRGILMFGGIAAMVLVVAALLFGFTLGTLFAWGMVALAGGYILYDTSNVLHHYRTDQHVAASLALFASFALLLWYVIRILMARRS